MYKIVTVLLVAGTAMAAVAKPGPEPQLLTNQRLVPTDNIGYIYYKPATGEMVRIGPGAVGGVGGGQSRGTSEPIRVSERTDQCDFGETFYSPIHDSATGEDTWWMDLGDIEANSCIDTITIFYVTDLPDPEEDGEDGFEMDIVFIDGIDVGQVGCGAPVYVTYTIAGLPGSAGGEKGWMLTVDLTGTGGIEIGDNDGFDACGNGLNSGGHGADLDGDGLMDFAYGISFRHPALATTGATGCVLVAPPEGTYPNSLGDQDWMYLFFTQDWDDPDGIYWFGEYDCAGGPGDWTPWASYYLGLYGVVGPPCSPADRVPDNVIDFFDLQDFLSDFAAEHWSADMNRDQLFDFFDVQIYLNLYSAGCP